MVTATPVAKTSWSYIVAGEVTRRVKDAVGRFHGDGSVSFYFPNGVEVLWSDHGMDVVELLAVDKVGEPLFDTLDGCRKVREDEAFDLVAELGLSNIV
jgi:hypothetical protein